MSNIIIYYNLVCGMLCNMLEMICNSGIELIIIYYLEILLMCDELVKFIVDMGIFVCVLLCKNVELYEELGFVEDKFIDDWLIDFMF